MNTVTKSEFKKIISNAFNNDIPEAFENIDNFKIFYRLNTKKDSNYGDIDGSRYHFSESSLGYKQFLENVQNNDVGIAYHDRTRDGFIGVGIIRQSNYVENPKSVLIIDEINRGNLSKIFGELIYGLEYRDESIKTQYSEFDENPRFLKIPKNLLVIGTMNTADRSISLFDTALRRRFSFMELLPDYDLLTRNFGLGDKFDFPTLEKQYENENSIDAKKKILSLLALNKINEIIADEIQLGREKQIGHSYLLRLAEKPTHFDIIWKYDIIPLLEEFFYAESNKLEHILTNKIFDSKKGIQDFDADELIESLEKIIKPTTENGS